MLPRSLVPNLSVCIVSRHCLQIDAECVLSATISPDLSAVTLDKLGLSLQGI